MSSKLPDVNPRAKYSHWPLIVVIVVAIAMILIIGMDDWIPNVTYKDGSPYDTIYHTSFPKDTPDIGPLTDKFGSSDGQVHVYAYFPKDDVEQRCFHVNGDPRQGSECYPVPLKVEIK